MTIAQSDCGRDSANACTTDAFILQLNPDGSLRYATYWGGGSNETARDIALDSTGNMYITGSVLADLPVVGAVFQPVDGDGSKSFSDAFVTKFAANGSPIYSTYLGGEQGDHGYGLVADAAGYAYVTGITFSNDFPKQNPLQTCAGGTATSSCWDAFVSKITPTGNALAFSTHLGSRFVDEGYDITLDSAGDVYVTGETGTSGFVAKLTGNGDAFRYLTRINQGGPNEGWGIEVDSQGCVYVTGVRNPASPTEDAFLLILNDSGRVELDQRFGGMNADIGWAVAVDADQNVFMVGNTVSTDFSVTAGAFQSEFAGDTVTGDAFVAKFSLAGVMCDRQYIYLPVVLRR